MSQDGGAAASSLNDFLDECVRLDASDLHLAPGLVPFFRVHGDLEPDATRAALSAADVERVAEVLMERAGGDAIGGTGACDGAFTSAAGVRYRFNVFRRLGGVAIAIRRLEERFRGLAELGLPEALYELCELPDGIVLMAGPTGAGKSTTLATLIDRINRTRKAHIITIEDPIEYVHAPLRCLVNQRQVGSDASSFNDALVASLREDPDVIFLGEVRDLDTIRTAIRAAETGHLVFTTVHASDCVSTIERLISVFPPEEQGGARQQLALVLRAVVAQRLLPADGEASAPSFRRPGKRGRVVASEILMATPAVAHLIASAKSAQIYSAMEAGGRSGMQTLEQDLARLWHEGKVLESTAVLHSRQPDTVRARHEMLARAGGPKGSPRRAAAREA